MAPRRRKDKVVGLFFFILKERSSVFHRRLYLTDVSAACLRLFLAAAIFVDVTALKYTVTRNLELGTLNFELFEIRGVLSMN
jgi:hypothetical protein